MEAMLREMRKLLPRPSAAGISQPPAQAAVPPSPKSKAQQLLNDLRSRLQEHKIQEVVARVAKIVVPPPKDPLVQFRELYQRGRVRKRSRNPELQVPKQLLRRAERRRIRYQYQSWRSWKKRRNQRPKTAPDQKKRKSPRLLHRIKNPGGV